MDAVRISCPRCGLARAFPAGRAPSPLPHHCPACGADLVAEGLLASAEPAEPAEPARQRAPPRVRLLPPPAAWEAAAVAGFALLLAVSWWREGWLARIVSGADLVFHEAGHPLLGLFGSRFLMFLGGTLAQLAFPAAAAFGFARQRRTAAVAVAGVWLGFNLVDVGRYAADASARALPLLAPDLDSHDWWNLLGMLGVRHRCRGIGAAFAGLGWLVWAGAPAWLGVRWLEARRAAAPPGAIGYDGS